MNQVSSLRLRSGSVMLGSSGISRYWNEDELMDSGQCLYDDDNGITIVDEKADIDSSMQGQLLCNRHKSSLEMTPGIPK